LSCRLNGVPKPQTRKGTGLRYSSPPLAQRSYRDDSFLPNDQKS
jgi:hypothetical protein